MGTFQSWADAITARTNTYESDVPSGADLATAVTTGLGSTFAPKFAQVVDLCAAPYNLVPGGDVTTALQTALDAAGASGLSTDIVLSKGGSYTMNGAQQTGTTLGYAYSGQVLIPARLQGQGIAIRIRGGAPIAIGGSARYPGGGVTIVSNATTGWIMDCHPGYTAFSATYPWTDVQLILENLIIQAPSDPQCGGINARMCSWFTTSNFAMRVTGAPSTPATKTGTKEAISPPQLSNEYAIQLDTTIIMGWPIAARLTEHMSLRDFRATWCQTAFITSGGEHVCTFDHVSVEDTNTTFKVDADCRTFPLVVKGTLTTEAPDITPVAFVDSAWPGCITGHLDVEFYSKSGPPNLAVFGYTYAGLDLTNLYFGEAGWMASHPIDNFLRSVTGGAGSIGLTWPTLHPWWVPDGSFAVSGGALTSTNGNSTSRATLPVKNGRTGGESRAISATFTMGHTSPHVRIEPGRIIGGASGTDCFYLDIVPTYFRLGYRLAGVDHEIDESPIILTPIDTTHTVTFVVTHSGAGVPVWLSAWCDGVKYAEGPVPAAMGAVVGSGTFYPYLGDALVFYDAGTTCTSFIVRAAGAPDAKLHAAKVTLSAGTLVVSDWRVTANSIIRVSRLAAGGTLGDLSVALSAGTSFTINSNSGSDTSSVYYEVISY